jgi:tetratricopeptide (TPR) repeat protein
MGATGAAVHRTIMVVDVEGYGDLRRTNPNKIAIRQGLYRALQAAFAAAEVPWNECEHFDQGDAVFVLAPPHIAKAPFVESLPPALAEALRQYNANHIDREQICLRMVVHAGEVVYDEHGLAGNAVIHAFRLLDARPLKTALAESTGVLALIASSWFFDEVIRHSTAIDPATFRPTQVAVKETRTVGWIALPDRPHPPDAGLLAAAPRHTAMPVPQQLPAAPPGFIGRSDEFAALTNALNGAAERQDRAVVISAVAGAGGIGKTWLALHWAHQHLEQFPDGQLFVDLRGFSPDEQPMPTSVAVRGFLDAFAIDPARIPANLHAQAALLRSLLAGKRMLIVLDNATDTGQISALLPGSATCTVVVTSRHHLTGLISGHGARHLSIDVLTESEARALLSSRLGEERLAAEPAAVDELLACCNGFPLALSIVAGRAETYSELSLAELAVELREAQLSLWDEHDPTASLPTVLSWSYRALSDEQARLFELLGIAPGPDISLPAAVSLAGRSTGHVRAALRGLQRASLLGQVSCGRYRMHDLIRHYAADQAHRRLSATDRETALRRVVDFYLHTAHAGSRLLYPYRGTLNLQPLATGCTRQTLSDETSVMAWFDAEHHSLRAAQRLAAQRGWSLLVWQMGWALNTFHRRRGYIHDDIDTWMAGLAAARQLGDSTAEAWAHRFLAHGYVRMGLDKTSEAYAHLQAALTISPQADIVSVAPQMPIDRLDDVGQPECDEIRRTLSDLAKGLRLYEAVQDPLWEADAHSAMGWLLAQLDEYHEARNHCESALVLFREHFDRTGEAATLDSLGYIALRSGRHEDSLTYYYQALALRRDIGDAYNEADNLSRLGDAHAAANQHDEARKAWQQALSLYRGQRRATHVEQIRHRLLALNDA